MMIAYNFNVANFRCSTRVMRGCVIALDTLVAMAVAEPFSQFPAKVDGPGRRSGA